MNITFICTGNICRSPFAEKLLQKISDQRDLHYSVTSMGTINKPGFTPPEDAVAIAAEFDIDLSTHESRAMDAKYLMKSDYIFVMDRTHLEYINNFYPMIVDRTHLLAPYKKSGLFISKDVVDPFKKSRNTFKKVYAEINKHIQRILPLE